MFKAKTVRLYHPDEVEVMKKVIKKLGKYAKQTDIQKQMWPALREVRKEILNGTKNDENITDGLES